VFDRSYLKGFSELLGIIGIFRFFFNFSVISEKFQEFSGVFRSFKEFLGIFGSF
jgi:hypothetical protein